MGNKLYVDANVSNINEIINFDIHNLKGDIISTNNYHNLKVWQFYENDDEKIQCKPVNMPSIKEDRFLLSSLEVYIILLVYKEEIAETASFPSSLWGIVESSSNMTPRGLKYAFSTSDNNSQNLESYLLSKRDFKDSEYKYVLFIWNGKSSSALLKSEALMRAFDLDKKLSDPTILPYLYSGYYITGDKINAGKTLNLNAIINNTIEHFSEEVPLTPSAETFLNYHETVYLLQWLYPINDEKRNSTEKKVLFQKFNSTFLSKGKSDYYKCFVNLDSDMKDIPPINKDEALKEDSYEDNDTSSLNDEELVTRNDNRTTTTSIKGFSLGLGNLKKENSGVNNNNAPEDNKVPKLNMSIQQRFLSDEAVTTRNRQNIQEEEKFDNLPPQTIIRASDELISRNLLGLRINNRGAQQREDSRQNIQENDNSNDEEVDEISRNNQSQEEEEENDYLQESERKEVLMDYYNKNISIIIEGFLYLSGYNVAQNKDIIDANRITHIINAASDVCQNHFEEKCKYLNYNLKDHSSEVLIFFKPLEH
jgi:hypothetical protein